MNEKLRIDFSNMFKNKIGNFGLCKEDLSEFEAMVPSAHKKMCEKKDAMAWRELPFNQDEIIKDIEETAKKINNDFENFVVLGIGGSALGSKALFSALKHPRHNELKEEKRDCVKFYVVDNVDPDQINALFDVIDVKKTAFHVITKSGATVETLAQFIIAINKLKEALGDGFKNNIFITTDKEKGMLKKLSDEHGFKTFIVPDGVGGRFSVLCPVGLLSAAVLNIDIKGLLNGAKDMMIQSKEADISKNPAYMYALLHMAAMKKGVNISVLMPYANALMDTAEWYAQLWAESLGKEVDNNKNKVYYGQTPVRALGVTDQHSQIQLYREGPFDKIICFIDTLKFDTICEIPKCKIDMHEAKYVEESTMNDLIAYELSGTKYAVTKSGKMNMSITLDKIDAYNIGALFALFEMATAFAGELLDIDAFNQPGVEEGKEAAFALMGRSGYEELKSELEKSKPDDKSKNIYVL